MCATVRVSSDMHKRVRVLFDAVAEPFAVPDYKLPYAV